MNTGVYSYFMCICTEKKGDCVERKGEGEGKRNKRDNEIEG